MKVMTLNVLSGGEERLDALLALMEREAPDVIVLQECVGWEGGEQLHRVATALKLPAGDTHVRLGTARPRPSGTRYHVAIASRFPLRAVQVHNDPRFLGHCLLRCELDSVPPLTVFGTHFDAHSENLRFVEARYLRSLLDATTFPESSAILLGDLNSLSRRDPYPADLADRVRRAGVDKYGHPPRFEVIDELESSGWVDVLRHRPTASRWVTARRQRGGERIDYRTDYIFASPGMAERLLYADVVPTNQASDHEALLATFRDA
jgi:exodeoxyribonuclease-3